ncbi:hypothetical protein ACFS7Z_24555 [Pontibacter toksunensis]|uniref:Concanavalin A-like lectin/glucanase superfamily protein n=1 Tax=Pontibacter toksunensis TaxID=1332631 RepID=A0ABW6C2Z6_9BACT
MSWMYGDYYDWIVSASRPKGYATGIRTNMAIPTGNIDLKKRLLKTKTFAKVTPEDKYKIAVPKTKAFSLTLTLLLDSAAYYGQLVKFAGLTYHVPKEERAKPYLQSGGKIYASTNVLGNSDGWQKKARGTGGQWYAPEKLETFQLAISYQDGVLRTYINGLVDQFVEIPALQLSEVTVGGFTGAVHDVKIYGRVLSQDEIKALRKNQIPTIN